MPSNCYLSDYPSAQAACYTAHHESVIYYANVRADCQHWNVPLGTVTSGALAADIDNDTLPAYAVIGPGDDCGNSAAGGEVDPPKSDAFLKAWVDRIAA